MKNKIRVMSAIAGLGMILGAQNAMAGKVTLELLANADYSMGTGSPTPTSALGYPGGGLNLNFGLGSKVAFQVGGQYIVRNLVTDLSYNATVLSGNAGFKINPSRALALILSGYYNRYFTNPMGLSSYDYGAAVGIGLAIPLGSSLDFYINPTYHYSLMTQTYGTSSTLKANEILLSVGFVIGGGSK